MSKYYRVRTQEQWEWLVNRFGQPETQWPEQGMHFGEICECLASGGSVIVHYDYFPSVGSVLYTTTPQNNGNVIEVSDLMEESKMKDYVTINSHDLEKIKFDRPQEDGNSFVVNKVNPLGDSSKYTREVELPVRLRIPKSLLYPKVRMTEAEKKEFDDVKKHVTALYNAMVLIFEHRDECINLNNKLFYSAPPKYLNDVQRDFARAWADPSLIEVIPEKKWNVKVPPFERTNKYYYKFGEKLRWAGRVGNDDEDQQFTADELKEYGLDDDMYEKVEVKE